MKILILLTIILCFLTNNLAFDYKHPECGESPAIKYKKLAARIGI